MKYLNAVIVALLLVLPCSAQDQGTNADQPKTGFDWLRQFEGSWEIETSNAGPGENSGEHAGSATMTARVLGGQWVTWNQVGKVGGTQFEAIQTVGYDAKRKEYFGTWVDSTSNYTWNLRGTVDESGKKLILGSQGKDWSDPTKTRQYRDVYEFTSAKEIATKSQMKSDDGKWTTFMSSKMTKQEKEPMAETTKPSMLPFLMFTGQAEEAIAYYKTIFPDVEITSLVKYKAGEAGAEGTIKTAKFVVAGQTVMCTDSPPVHDFTFTPSFSFFVECEDLDSLKERFGKLSEGGKVMMPLNNYGFSEQFGWCSDKFGVSWQLNLNMVEE